MTPRIPISPSQITWAIVRAGFDLQEFTIKHPKVLLWLDEKKQPTVKQLEKFAKQVYVPFGYLLLDEPPKEKLPIPFFRTGKGMVNHVDVHVYDTILMLQKRQEWLVAFLEEREVDPLPFVGKFTLNTGYQEIVADIKRTLALEDNWAAGFPIWEKTLDFLTKRIEEVGIIMTFNGVVGNNTRRPIEVEACRGFVLVDEMAPFMFVNNRDAKSAQMFTIIHELAHIWLGKSAGFDFRQLVPADDPIEKLCDQVAAEFLVPAELLYAAWDGTEELPKEVKRLGRIFKVSPIVIGRRALDLGKISKVQFFAFYNSYMNQNWEKKQSQGSGGDFYATSKKRISLKFAAYINQALNQNDMMYRDAYKLTNLKGGTYQAFVEKYAL